MLTMREWFDEHITDEEEDPGKEDRPLRAYDFEFTQTSPQ